MSKLLLLVVTSGVIMGLWSSTSVNERIHKRWISYGEHEVLGNVTHLYSTNSWYRYASMQANRLDRTNCYVCTLMPTSYFHPRLKSRLLSFQAMICVGEKCAPDNWGYSKPFYYTDDTQVQDLCNNTHPLAELKNMPQPSCHLKWQSIPYS